MRWILALCLLASGCLPDAEARGPGSRRMQRRGQSTVLGSGGGGAPDAGSIFGYTWDYFVSGANCPGYDGGVQDYPIVRTGADGGALAWGYGSDAGTYSCGVSTSWAGGALVGAGGVGPELIDHAIRLVEGSATGCWRNSESNVPAIADGDNIWCRLMIRTGDNTTTRYMTSYGTASTDVWSLTQSSTERSAFSFRTGGSTALAPTTAVLSTTPYYLIDWFYNGADPTNPSVDSWVSGTETLGAEHSANLAGLSAGGPLAIGGIAYQACSVAGVAPDVDIVAIGCAIGTNASQFTGAAMHNADCTASGACP